MGTANKAPREPQTQCKREVTLGSPHRASLLLQNYSSMVEDAKKFSRLLDTNQLNSHQRALIPCDRNDFLHSETFCQAA